MTVDLQMLEFLGGEFRGSRGQGSAAPAVDAN